jgi:hypothetical protein
LRHSPFVICAWLVMLSFSFAWAAEPRRPKLEGPSRCAVRPDGVLVVNGSPVFPFGFYISSGHTGAIRTRCVELVAGIGGNVVHIEGPWHEDTAFLDRAAELGVYVVAGHTETEAKLGRVHRFRDHPAIIAWTLFDDANTLSNVAHLKRMNALVKTEAPNHLTFIPIGTQSRDVVVPAPGFFECSDLVGWENYPIAARGATDPSIRATETQMALVRKTARALHRPIWILPQTFAWPGGRVPTPAEFRNLCYVGLANDAKGVMPWAIFFRGDTPEVRARKLAERNPHLWDDWFLPDSEPLWNECKAMAHEIQLLTPALVGGVYTKLDTGGDLSAACWTSAHESVVVVASLTDKKATPVLIPLPRTLIGQPERAFPGRPAGLRRNDAGKLTGEVGPADVHVYRFRVSP